MSFCTDHNPELSAGNQYGLFSSLTDEAECDSSFMFLSLLKSYIQASERDTHVLCWQRKTLKYLESLKNQVPSKLHVHNCLADFNGWIDQGKSQLSAALSEGIFVYFRDCGNNLVCFSEQLINSLAYLVYLIKNYLKILEK